MRAAHSAILLGSTLALSACATAPTPVVGLPSPGKDIATFQKEDTACRQEASEAAHAPVPTGDGAATAAPTNSNAQWQIFFDRYARCETAHGNVVQPVPWAAAYADYLGTNTAPYAYAAYGYGYPYAYTGYPVYYGGPFLFGYPYPLFIGAGFGFRYGHVGYGHFGGGFHGGGHR